MELRIIFSFIGMFMVYLDTFCPRNLMVEIKIVKTGVFFLNFC